MTNTELKIFKEKLEALWYSFYPYSCEVEPLEIQSESLDSQFCINIKFYLLYKDQYYCKYVCIPDYLLSIPGAIEQIVKNVQQEMNNVK